jgi:hypothetical protein
MKAKYWAFIVVATLFVLLLTWPGSPPPLAAQDIEVTSADPAEAEQDTVNLDVTIKGKGFDRSAKAKFFLAGTTDPGGVTVNSTRFVSPAELVANIDVAVDAVIAKRDIVVQARKGRTGKGTELFSVTEKSTGQPCEMSTPPIPSGFSLVTELNPNPPAFGGEFGRKIEVRSIDLDQDTVDDALVVAVGSLTSGTVEVFLLDRQTGYPLPNHPHITLAPDSPEESLGGPSSGPFMGDIDADGIPDIAAGPNNHHNVYVFLGSISAGVLRYEPEARIRFQVVMEERGGRAIGDVTGDGFGDLILGDPRAEVANQRMAGRVLVYSFNPNSRTFEFFREITKPTPYRYDVFGVGVAVGDVMGSLADDLAVGAYGVHVGKARDAGMVFAFSGPLPAAGALPTPVELTTAKKGANIGYRVTTGNVNDDSYADVIAVGYLKPPTVVFNGPVLGSQNADFTLDTEPELDGGYGTNIAAGDLNGDNLVDVLVGSPNITEGSGMCTTGGTYIYLSSGGQPLSSRFLLRPHIIEGAGLYGWSVAPCPGTPFFLVSEIRDVDGDGTKDGQVYVFRKD